MDITALQATLRAFAAERDWERFHTPKNLATALMVEAAEVAEIFQWMTPEQSQSACTDVVTQEQVADEIADVFLYLLQLADLTGVDLKRAVGRKLQKNERKHPPLRPGHPSAPRPAEMRTYVFVDYENVQPDETEVRKLVPDVTDVLLFHGLHQKGMERHFASFGERFTAVQIARPGKNALDFHLSFYMGYVASRNPKAHFVIVAKDGGYGPMVEHVEGLGFDARQERTDSEAKPAAKKTAGKKSPPAKTPTAKAAPQAKKPVAKKAAPAKKTTAAKAPAAKKAVAKKITPGTSHGSSANSSGFDALIARVIDSLRNMGDKRPRKRTKLERHIGSVLGPADASRTHAVITELQAFGKLHIDSAGGVEYWL